MSNCGEKMQKENEILDIRVRLEGEVKEKFLQIKKVKGLTNNTEVLRFIINEFYESTKREKEGVLRGGLADA